MCLSHYLPFYGIVYPTKYPPWVSIRHVGSHPSILSTSHGPKTPGLTVTGIQIPCSGASSSIWGWSMGFPHPNSGVANMGGIRSKWKMVLNRIDRLSGVAIWDQTLVAMEILVCGKSGLSFVIQAVDLYNLISPLKNEPRYSQQGLKKVLLPMAEKSSNTIEPIWYHWMLRETTAKFSQKVV